MYLVLFYAILIFNAFESLDVETHNVISNKIEIIVAL